MSQPDEEYDIQAEMKRMWDSAERFVERTTDRIERGVVEALRRTQLVDVPADVKQMRDEIKKRRDEEKSVKRGLWNAIWHGLGVVKSEGDKLLK